MYDNICNIMYVYLPPRFPLTPRGAHAFARALSII